jgi:hypothetical protein
VCIEYRLRGIEGGTLRGYDGHTRWARLMRVQSTFWCRFSWCISRRVSARSRVSALQRWCSRVSRLGTACTSLRSAHALEDQDVEGIRVHLLSGLADSKLNHAAMPRQPQVQGSKQSSRPWTCNNATVRRQLQSRIKAFYDSKNSVAAQQYHSRTGGCGPQPLSAYVSG